MCSEAPGSRASESPRSGILVGMHRPPPARRGFGVSSTSRGVARRAVWWHPSTSGPLGPAVLVVCVAVIFTGFWVLESSRRYLPELWGVSFSLWLVAQLGLTYLIVELLGRGPGRQIRASIEMFSTATAAAGMFVIVAAVKFLEAINRLELSPAVVVIVVGGLFVTNWKIFAAPRLAPLGEIIAVLGTVALLVGFALGSWVDAVVAWVPAVVCAVATAIWLVRAKVQDRDVG